LGITWVDWNPTPPTRTWGSEGSHADFERSRGAAESIRQIKFGAEYKTAELTLSANLRNQTEKTVKVRWWQKWTGRR